MPQNNQYGFLCLVETPEGHKIGLQKHLALMANVTIDMPSQENIVIEFLKDKKIIDIRDLHPFKFKDYVKVFVNGDWLGFVENGYETFKLFKKRDK